MRGILGLGLCGLMLDYLSMQEEWRIDMLPIQFLFLNARPIIDMRLRCKSKGKDYPAGVPCDITKVLELKIVSFFMDNHR